MSIENCVEIISFKNCDPRVEKSGGGLILLSSKSADFLRIHELNAVMVRHYHRTKVFVSNVTDRDPYSDYPDGSAVLCTMISKFLSFSPVFFEISMYFRLISHR